MRSTRRLPTKPPNGQNTDMVPSATPEVNVLDPISARMYTGRNPTTAIEIAPLAAPTQLPPAIRRLRYNRTGIIGSDVRLS